MLVHLDDDTEFERIEEALLAKIQQAGTPVNVVQVIRTASQDFAPSRVREAYWELVSEGRIAADSAGNLRTLASA